MIFDVIRAWRERRQVLRELSVEQRIDREYDTNRFQVLLERIEAAMAADQRDTAIGIWREVNERFSAQASKSQKMFNLLLDLRELDGAERLINDGFSRRPNDQFYIVGRAQVAELRGDISIALQRWSIVRKKFPFLDLGYSRPAACLIRENRFEDAEILLEQGIKRCSDNVHCLIEYARIAEARSDFEEAIVRWQRMRNAQHDPTHPCYQNGTIGLGQCLSKIGRFDEAEALLQDFQNRFGSQIVILIELARIAEGRGTWEEAINRWQLVKAKFPMTHAGYHGQIQALKSNGQTAAVDAVMRELMDRFPDELALALDYANNAYAGADYQEIAHRWVMITERFPNCEIAYNRGADAFAALGNDASAAALLAEAAKRFPK